MGSAVDVHAGSMASELDRRRMPAGDGQIDGERGAGAFAGTGRPSAAAVQFDDMADDRESEAQPSMGSCR